MRTTDSLLGVWGVGLATRKCGLNSTPLGRDSESWVIRNDGTMWHHNQEKSSISKAIEEGDILVSFNVHDDVCSVAH